MDGSIITKKDSRLSFTQLILIFSFLLLFTGSLINLDGGDWDGVQITIGSIFFEEAAQGYIKQYNFNWQPLTYGIIRTIYLLTDNTLLLFYLPAVFGSLGMTIYLASMYKAGNGRFGIAFLLGILFLMPEFIFDSIYMNSTVFGLPFAAAAIWLILDLKDISDKPRRCIYECFLAGICAAVATLCRFDFLLAYPMFLFLLFGFSKKNLLQKIIIFAVGSIIVLAVAWPSGFFNPVETVKTVFGHEAGVGESGVFYRSGSDRLLLSYIGINTFAWLLIGIAVIHSVYLIVLNRKWLNFLVIIPVLILCYPVKSIATPKYLIPLYMFLGLFISSFLSKIIFRKKLFYPVSSAILAACVLLACFLPLCPTHKNGLSLLVTSNTWKETDDGPRSFWGYCFSIRNYSARKRIPDELDRYKCNPENLLIAGPYDGWVSGTQSQSYVLFIVKNCEKIKADSEYVFGEINGKKIVLTDPSNISQNLEKHFSSAGIIPVQIFVELPLNDIENQVLKQISVSEVPVTIDALIKELGNDKETISKAVTELRKRGLIELTGNDTYKLIYKIE